MQRARRIPLRARNGRVKAYALVDAADFEELSRETWRLLKGAYAVRYQRVDGVLRAIMMHREILGLAPDDPREVDHVDGNGLNNRRLNLRPATRSENCQNRGGYGGSSRFRGVSRHRKVWIAKGEIEGKQYYLGTYDDELAAADVAAKFRAENMPYSPEAREALAEAA